MCARFWRCARYKVSRTYCIEYCARKCGNNAAEPLASCNTHFPMKRINRPTKWKTAFVFGREIHVTKKAHAQLRARQENEQHQRNNVRKQICEDFIHYRWIMCTQTHAAIYVHLMYTIGKRQATKTTLLQVTWQPPPFGCGPDTKQIILHAKTASAKANLATHTHTAKYVCRFYVAQSARVF